MFGTFSVGVNKAAESSHTLNTFLIPLTYIGVFPTTLMKMLSQPRRSAAKLISCVIPQERTGGIWQFHPAHKGTPVQRCPISPIIHGEGFLISSGTRLITVTITKTAGTLVSLGGGDAAEASLHPIKPSSLKGPAFCNKCRAVFRVTTVNLSQQWVSVAEAAWASTRELWPAHN